MTVPEILKRVSRFKPMTRVTLYTHLRKARIRPRGISQRPQQYPDDAAEKILIRLGYDPKQLKLSLPRNSERRAA